MIETKNLFFFDRVWLKGLLINIEDINMVLDNNIREYIPNRIRYCYRKRKKYDENMKLI